MKKTKIDWCDSTWNPVTGCYHDCRYCYARNIANRFKGGYKEGSEKSIHYCKDREGRFTKSGRIAAAPFPYGFEPTFHEYRLEDIIKPGYGLNVFVCSTADLFGEWVPDEWIEKVFDACIDGKRYLFLTKNPSRYTDLGTIALLPHEENFWYGSTVTTDDDTGFYDSDRAIHTFLSVEPLLGPVNLSGGTPEWVIIGAETGNRINKVIPERKWVDDIRAFCEKASIPAFYKDSLRKLFPDLPESRFPWK